MQKTLTYTLIIGLFAALFIPFIVADSQLFPFITGKAFTFRILVEFLFAVWLVGLLFVPDLRPRFSWVTGSVLIFGAVIALADISGVSFYKSFWSNFERMDGFITTLHLIAYFLVVSSTLTTRLRWNYFFNTSIFASVIMAFYVFLQLGGKLTINQGGVRVDGTFGNATYLAVYMLFNFFIVLILACRTYQDRSAARGWLLYAWYPVAILCQLISLYFTATRGAILGLLGGVLLAALILAIFEKGQPFIRKVSVGVLLGVVLLVGIFFGIRNTGFVTNSPTLSRFASLSVEQVSTQGRRYVWPMAWQGFKEHPILGWGQENFNYVFNKYYDPRMYNQEPWFDRAHNIVLDWLVVGGLLGLLSYLSMLVFFFWYVWKSEGLSLIEKSLLTGLMCAYFFQNLFVFDNQISYLYFFAFLALVHSEFVRSKNPSNHIEDFVSRTPQIKVVVPIVVLVGLVWTVYAYNARPIMASKNIIRGLTIAQTDPINSLDYFKKTFGSSTFADREATEQLFNQYPTYTGPNATSEVVQAYGELALTNLEIQVNKYPTDARALLFMGSLSNRLGDYAGALPFLSRAQAESPKKQSILFEIGMSYLSTGNNKKALENFKAAYDLAPDFSEAKILYAIGFIYDKNLKQAKELLATIPVEQLVSEERLIAAFAANGQMAEATHLVEMRVGLQPDVLQLRFRLSAGYLEMGQRAKSVEILRQAAVDFPEYKTQIDYYIKEIQAGRNP